MSEPQSFNAPALPERLLTSKDYATWRGWEKEQTARRERWAGGGPRFVRVGGRVFYRPADLREWLAALPSFGSTSDPGPAEARSA